MHTTRKFNCFRELLSLPYHYTLWFPGEHPRRGEGPSRIKSKNICLCDACSIGRAHWGRGIRKFGADCKTDKPVMILMINLN
jgi:hypothetical protein